MSGELQAIAFAEKVLNLLELGRRSATYKYALFTALLDLSLERTSRTGVAPTVLTTRQIAEKVVELYWAHAIAFDGRRVLRQGGNEGGQAEILGAIQRFREAHAAASADPLHRARRRGKDAFERLLRFVEWKLIEMPIPRLQVVGRDEDRFIYDYGWNQAIRQGAVSAYQRGDRGAFDNRLLLRPGVAETLLRLNGILRPLVRREWTSMVAGMNALPELELEEFLFGVDRTKLGAVRGPLSELQAGRCFYCDGRLEMMSDVDHFIPWVRYADNGLDNLVVAHGKCNNQKRDFLAAADHVDRWAERNVARRDDLAAIAESCSWDRDSERSRAVAVATYSRLPDGAGVWQKSALLVPLDRERVARAFALPELGPSLAS